MVLARWHSITFSVSSSTMGYKGLVFFSCRVLIQRMLKSPDNLEVSNEGGVSCFSILKATLGTEATTSLTSGASCDMTISSFDRPYLLPVLVCFTERIRS
jgi:hypothetical protein